MTRLRKMGLYDPAHEHDACGVGFVAHMKGEPSHEIIQQGLEILANLEHRGACGCDPLTGDGAGMLLQMPRAFFRKEAAKLGIDLPDGHPFAVGMVFLPQDAAQREACEKIIERVVSNEGQQFLGWRDVPIDSSQCGEEARKVLPVIRQFFVRGDEAHDDVPSLERELYVIRSLIETTIDDEGCDPGEMFHVTSLSTRTIVYKGLLIAWQMPKFYRDLNDSEMVSALAIVHQRFSTNTLPTWDRAHPYRYMAHNGEINTLRGNVNWMHAREKNFVSEAFGDDIRKIQPVIHPHGSDSAMFDNALELLVHTGRSLPHAMMMMIPEAWESHESMDPDRRAFYRYHASLMEPWDGPASIAFTDGTVIGAVLDRNGLRPSRYVVTDDDLVVMASEVGVLDIPPSKIVLKGRLQPGRMFLVDTDEGRIVSDEELKSTIAAQKPYGRWVESQLRRLDDLEPGTEAPPPLAERALALQQKSFGYTTEDLKILMQPMSENGQEAIGSMGTDTPPAVLSSKPQLLFHYFKQLFAQVTNPAIDPIREELVMSLVTTIGPQLNLFDETAEHCRHVELEQPILTAEDMSKLRGLDDGPLRTTTLSTLYGAGRGGGALEAAIDRLCADASRAIEKGASILVLSDRGVDRENAAIPSLLAMSAVHHHLIREGQRMQASLIVESGEPREVHHFCLLAGYGASAIHPYVALATLESLVHEGTLEMTVEEAIANYVKAIGKGILKVMSKMGISTLASYRGAQIFEAIGLSTPIIDRYFTWTASQIEGIGLDELDAEVKSRHDAAWAVPENLDGDLPSGGQYQWRRRGEYHMLNPETVAYLQHACRKGSYPLFKKYSGLINEQSEQLSTLRSLLRFRAGTPIPIDEVEPASGIVKRFKTGAMSFGSISKEAHENLAIAMNRIGGKSNTGEGGEDPARFTPDANGDSRRSAIKQVASGRFGVTSWYLVNSDELQIKIAQGAKPGEGGQLPGHKVDDFIAKIRYSTPGVGLISPPPHHDIYSIEDLAQLIHDLKNANVHGRVSVKLVSEIGVGTIAAGVAKGKADLVLISGYDGGTGASPLTSIKHAGTPWELGLAETQQVLVMNGLRSRIRVETDGQLKTGRDVAIAALLGAEEFGFSSAALVATGCIMMRVCHLNTCPVGIATQDPELRKKFEGKPEHVVNFMTFIAEELREIMAELGFRTVDEMVGRVDRLEASQAVAHWKAHGVDLSRILAAPDVPAGTPLRCTEAQDHGIEQALDNRLLELAAPALERGEPVSFELPIRNINRTVGTILSSEVSRRHGEHGLPDGTIRIGFRGTAGQSFGAFLANGIRIRLEGDANDYFCKGMTGGQVTVVPDRENPIVPEDNIIVGNVCLYGATGGKVFIHGQAGERFGVRNSGATAVVEGVGDHGCEYMTGGRVVVIGATGRNFAAGMSGGIAYVADPKGRFDGNCNKAMVEVEPLEDEDRAFLEAILREHVEATGSSVAERLLGDWETSLAAFRKVMPVDYRRVLDEQARAAAERERAAAV